MDQRLLTDLKASIRSIPDYPKPGIIFRDITTLLGDARRQEVVHLVDHGNRSLVLRSRRREL